jgi:hypothetical protein
LHGSAFLAGAGLSLVLAGSCLLCLLLLFFVVLQCGWFDHSVTVRITKWLFNCLTDWPVLALTPMLDVVSTLAHFRCHHCGVFELHPAAVGGHASSPVGAHIWYDRWLVQYASELEVQSGVAAHSFASVIDAVADWAEQQQTQPRETLPTNTKIFTPAMRHARVQQHMASSPATSGADIFSSVLGQCPPCAGRLTQMQQALPAEPQPLAALAGSVTEQRVTEPGELAGN